MPQHFYLLSISVLSVDFQRSVRPLIILVLLLPCLEEIHHLSEEATALSCKAGRAKPRICSISGLVDRVGRR